MIFSKKITIVIIIVSLIIIFAGIEYILTKPIIEGVDNTSNGVPACSCEAIQNLASLYNKKEITVSGDIILKTSAGGGLFASGSPKISGQATQVMSWAHVDGVGNLISSSGGITSSYGKAGQRLISFDPAIFSPVAQMGIFLTVVEGLYPGATIRYIKKGTNSISVETRSSTGALVDKIPFTILAISKAK
uniref:Uncharacterized protein n=1 Tax=Mimivirus LCMiAC01 TaxID=2506608 RepID=A0A481Z1S7_9VIRU|nr:MAG: hypothetical protein LCMiAC01_03240 [Mimivirus LCMiAC01]